MALNKNLSDYLDALDEKSGRPLGTLKSIAKIESSFNPDATSKGSSASGLFQFTKATASDYGLKDVFDPYESAKAADKYINNNLKRYNGDLSKAVLAFHTGPGEVDKYGLDTSKMSKYVTKDYLKHFNNAFKTYGNGSSPVDYVESNSTDTRKNDTQTASSTDSISSNSNYAISPNLFSDSNNNEQGSNNNVVQSQSISNNTPDKIIEPTVNSNGSTSGTPADANYAIGPSLFDNNQESAIINTDNQNNGGLQNAQNNNITNNNVGSSSQSSNVQYNSIPSNNNNSVVSPANNQNLSSNTNTISQSLQSQNPDNSFNSIPSGNLNYQKIPGLSNNEDNNLNPNSNVNNQPLQSLTPDMNSGLYQQGDLNNANNQNLTTSSDNTAQEKAVYDKFASLSPEQGTNYYMSLDDRHKGSLLRAIKNNLREDPNAQDVSPSWISNLARGFALEGGKISREINQGVLRGASATAGLFGADELAQNFDNKAQQFNNLNKRAKAVTELADAADGSIARDVGGLTADLATTLLAPGLGKTKALKYATQGAIGAFLTTQSDANSGSDYLKQKLIDSSVGGATGLLGGVVTDKAGAYLNQKFGNQIKAKSEALKRWADDNGISVSAFAFPEIKESLLNYLRANASSDSKLTKAIQNSNDDIVDYAKKYGNQFGDYFTNGSGEVVTANQFLKNQYPNVTNKLEEVLQNPNKKIEYGNETKDLIDKLSNPADDRELFGTLAKIDMLDRRMDSTGLYNDVTPDMKKFLINPVPIQNEIKTATNDLITHGTDSVEGSAYNHVVSKFPDSGNVSAQKLANIKRDLQGSIVDNARGAQARANRVYINSVDAIDNYINTQRASNTKMNDLYNRFDKAQSNNKVNIQDTYDNALSNSVFTKDLNNLDKFVKNNDVRSLQNVWDNLSAPGQRTMQNYLYTKAISDATGRDGINASVLSNKLRNITDSTVGKIVFKNNLEDINNIATLSKNIDLNLTKNAKNGSLVYNALNAVKNSVGYAGALTIAGGAQQQNPYIAGAGAAAAIYGLFLRNNTSKILASKELRNQLFELNKINPATEAWAEMSSAFIRSVINDKALKEIKSINGENPEASTSQGSSSLQELRSKVGVDQNMQQNNNSSNGTESLQSLRQRYGVN